MKVLMATKEGQGTRKNDFSHTQESEFVIFAIECDCESVDGVCGCKRSMIGMTSAVATTTFKVAEIQMTKEEYLSKIRNHWIKTGWMKYLKENDVKSEGKELMEIASHFPVGTILEKRGSTIRIRKVR